MFSSAEALEILRKSRPFTRLLVLGTLLYFLSLPILQRGMDKNDARIVLTWVGFALLLEMALAVSALLLLRNGPKTSLMPLVWAGVLVIVAAIWSDVLATVFNTPDMTREGNAIIIFLRENGFALWIQYLVGFVAQFLLTVISCALWAAFARHLPLYQAALLAMRPQSLLEFLWASLGGRTYFSKTEHLKISRSYRFVWWLVLPLIMPFDRFFLALEWMKVLPAGSFLTPLVTFLQTGLSFVLLISWLLYIYFQNRAGLRSDPELTRRAHRANLKQAILRLSLLFIATCALTCLSGAGYLWLTREPEYLATRLEYAPETALLNQPFPVTLIIENIGARKAFVTSIQTTAWEPNETVVSEKLLFALAVPPASSSHTYGPQTTLEYQNMTLLPGDTFRVKLWFSGVQPGEALLKTSIYSGWRKKMLPPVPIHILSPQE